MGFCEFCKKWVSQPEGKKKKRFCSETCRSNFWYAKNKKGKTAKIEPSKNESDAANMPANFTKDKPLSFDQMRQEAQNKQPTVNFYELLNNAEDLDELERIGRRIKSSGMTWKEQQKYHDFGKEVAKKKFID